MLLLSNAVSLRHPSADADAVSAVPGSSVRGSTHCSTCTSFKALPFGFAENARSKDAAMRVDASGT
jgi:hypothetical protein